MTYRKCALVAAAATLAIQTAAGAAAAQDFTWSGAVPQGRAIEIKGVNGDVRAEPSGSNQVEVTAVKTGRRDDPASVRIEVVPHGGGVTICAVYPSAPGREANRWLIICPGIRGCCSGKIDRRRCTIVTQVLGRPLC